MRVFVVWLICLGSAAQADWPCDDWWFTRNLIFDRAGQCFSTPLARATFDGACTGTAQLTAEDAARVARIRTYEEEWACAVDTSRVRALQVSDMGTRRSLVDLPITGGYEFGCIGYRWADITLRVGRSQQAEVTGRIRAQDDILFAFEDEEGWSFLISGEKQSGWAPALDMDPPNPDMCEGYAG